MRARGGLEEEGDGEEGRGTGQRAQTLGRAGHCVSEEGCSLVGLALSPWTGPLALPVALPSLLPRTPAAPEGSFSVSGRELSWEQEEPHPAEGLALGFIAQQHFISSFLLRSQVDKIVTCSTYKKLLSGEGGCPRPHRTGTRTTSLNPSATPAGPPSLS